MLRRPLPRVRLAAAALVAGLVAVACGAPSADEVAVERGRTCASLRERVAARALEEGGLLSVLPLPEDELEKPGPLSPLTFLDDPEAWYAALEAALAEVGLGPTDEPSPVSPATRLVQTCQRLDG